MKRILNHIEIANAINKSSTLIVDNITNKDIEKYLFLRDTCANTNIEYDERFRKTFSAYYRMRFVTKEFRAEFFKTMGK